MHENFNFAYTDYDENAKKIVEGKGFSEKDLPLIYGIDFFTNEILIYKGELELTAISRWMM